MPTYPLPYRIIHYLNRQIAWADAVIAELDAFCSAGPDADYEDALRQQQRRARETRDLAKEYQALHREWLDAEDISAEDHAEITRLSHDANARMQHVREAYNQAEAASAGKREANRLSRNDLRRGRRSVNIYRPGTFVAPGFIDRKA